jgi:3-deoxy-D-manno-octulosonic-acid transferase
MHLAAVFHPKAKKWVEGRSNWHEQLSSWRTRHPGKLYWFHCASVGEFEQGRPLIEAIKQKQPEVLILITFFSPSGYEMRKHYAGADFVMYLPADLPAQANKFLSICKADKAFFIKYEYWANYFFACKKHGVPLYVVSGILRENQRFFGMFKTFWTSVMACVDTFFVQNQKTAHLLASLGFRNVLISGDTRYDRVMAIKTTAQQFETIEEFCAGKLCLVAGSTWAADESVLRKVYENQRGHIRMIIVPHEISESRLTGIERQWPGAVRWTKLSNGEKIQSDVLIIDAMGILSSVYRYAGLAYVGGGFGAGIHNTLEAAVWGIPIVFGPNHQKFQEAEDLLVAQAAITDQHQHGLAEKITTLCRDKELRSQMGASAGALATKNIGATALILSAIEG